MGGGEHSTAGTGTVVGVSATFLPVLGRLPVRAPSPGTAWPAPCPQRPSPLASTPISRATVPCMGSGGGRCPLGGQVPLRPQQPQLRGGTPPTPPPASPQDALGMTLQSPHPRPHPEEGLLMTVSPPTSPFIIENVNLFLRPVRCMLSSPLPGPGLGGEAGVCRPLITSVPLPFPGRARWAHPQGAVRLSPQPLSPVSKGRAF